jgi:hypothetical protein
MSSALAIAAVSALLRNVLDNGVMDDSLVGSVGTVRVSTLAPDLIALGNDTPNQLNVFLYQVSPNLGWRNSALPSRDARGDRLTNPPLALNLHYLITAYAARELHAEILLGRAMQILHEIPVLTRELIRRGVSVPDLVTSPSLLPPDLRSIAASALDEQVESIKITPHASGAEEMSKIWAALQSKYRPSTAYDVSVVLIESRRPTRRALPVLRRELRVVPLQAPRIERVLSRAGSTSPPVAGDAILAGHTLLLEGVHLKGDRTRVQLGAIPVMPDASEVLDSSIPVPLPPELPAGLHTVQVIHERQSPGDGVRRVTAVSNLASFLLRPRILQAQMTGAQTLQLDLEPPVHPRQQAIVFLNERAPLSSPPDSDTRLREYSIVVPPLPPTSPPQPVTGLTVPLPDVEPGEYLVRIQIDGAESPLEVDAQGRFSEPSVVVA